MTEVPRHLRREAGRAKPVKGTAPLIRKRCRSPLTSAPAASRRLRPTAHGLQPTAYSLRPKRPSSYAQPLVVPQLAHL